jgi:hypothetical protein
VIAPVYQARRMPLHQALVVFDLRYHLVQFDIEKNVVMDQFQSIPERYGFSKFEKEKWIDCT